MPDAPEIDEQDVAEAFDEDNTNVDEARYDGAEDAEQFEDLVDVFDVTTKVGDKDDDEAVIGEDLDDDEIVESAVNDDDDDEEDDDLAARFPERGGAEDPGDPADLGSDDPDLVDDIDAPDADEAELEYDGDLSDLQDKAGGVADLESDTLSDADLRELDYKE